MMSRVEEALMELKYRARSSDAQIALVEARVGAFLPSDYRNWLSTTDGADVAALPMLTIAARRCRLVRPRTDTLDDRSGSSACDDVNIWTQ